MLCAAAVLPSLPSMWAANLPFVEVAPDATTALRLRGTGQIFVPVGVNYFGPHVGWAPKLWQQFDPATVRNHLRLVHEQGFNTIRVFLTLESFHRRPGVVHEEGLAKFRQLLASCREQQIRVIPCGPDHWEGVPKWTRFKDPFADEQMLEATATWWGQFVSAFQDEPVVLAWDLLNEPSIRWNTEAMKARWNQWLQKKYDSVQAVAKAHGLAADRVGTFGDIAVPPYDPSVNADRLLDYQLFRESIADHWTQTLTSAIRKHDKNHLITIGHIQWAGTAFLPGLRHYAGFNLKTNSQYVDFVTIHFYPLAQPRPCDAPNGIKQNAGYLEALLAECQVGKPVMIGEFGWYGGGDIRRGARVVMPSQTEADQVKWNSKLLDVSRGRVCGWLNWAFADTPDSQDLTRWSGLWTEDLTLKPWGREFGVFARDVANRTLKPRPFSDRIEEWQHDRRAVLTGRIKNE